ncbi:hypothetical protein Ancab_036300 [Ancistrocladus abbreviatus]
MELSSLSPATGYSSKIGDFLSPEMPSSPLKLFWPCFFILFPTSIFTAFSIPFLPTKNVALDGDAYFINNAVSLTQEHPCSSSSSPSPSLSPPSPSPTSFGFGRALYAYPIRFLDPRTNRTTSFSCRFSFSIIPSPLCSSGDGIAFFITSNVDFSNQENQHMGLPVFSSDSQDIFFAVEFDTNFDGSVDDINANHVGIDVNSFTSLAAVDAYSKGINFSNGRHITAWIEYRDSEKMLRVWVSYYLDKPPNPLLDAQIDLSKHLKEFMHVGFSATNGRGSAIHTVDRWRFKTFGFLSSSTTQMDATADDEGYCFMCPPEETDDEREEFDEMSKRMRTRDTAFILGGVASLAFSLIASVVLLSCWVNKRLGRDARGSQISTLQLSKVPARLSLAEIKSATAGFCKSRIVGEGASAVVYRGFLVDGKEVAVKRFKSASKMDCFINPFTTEFAAMARCLRHRNLVQLLGWCCEHNELVLVFEYLPNGSLDKILHESSDSINVLTWDQRLNIVLGIASVLTYLHEECDRQIIHRDVKTCNILIDADFTAKLGDFGLAEVYDHSSSPREATIPAGTMGYLAPEYVYCGVPSAKTDVYSFGVVILEVASGRRPVDEAGVPIGNWVWGLWEKGTLIEAVDSRLKGRYSRTEMDRMLKVGLCCVHPDSEKRPTMKEAARMLRGEEQLPVFPLKKPKAMLHSLLPKYSEDRLSSAGEGTHGFDDTLWWTPSSQLAETVSL